LERRARDSAVKVVLFALVMAGGSLTVSVKFCVPLGAIPLLTRKVRL